MVILSRVFLLVVLLCGAPCMLIWQIGNLICFRRFRHAVIVDQLPPDSVMGMLFLPTIFTIGIAAALFRPFPR
jgi:hypothetical protein